MTRQQKIWLKIEALLWAVKPLAVYIFMPGFCAFVGILIRRPGMTTEEFWNSSGNFYTAAGMTAAVIYLYRKNRKTGGSFWQETSLYPERTNLKRAAAFAAFGAAVSMALSAALTLISFRGKLLLRYAKASGGIYSGTDLCFLLFSLLFLAPVLEELIFRGFMLNRLKTAFRENTAVILVSAVFALCHADPVWAFYSFFMGLLLARLALREENICHSICVHAGFNLPSVVIFFVGRGTAFRPGPFGTWILTAVCGGFGIAAAVRLWKWCGEEGR